MHHRRVSRPEQRLSALMLFIATGLTSGVAAEEPNDSQSRRAGDSELSYQEDAIKLPREETS